MDIENHNYAQQKLIMKQTISTCTCKQLSTENTVREVVLSDLNFAHVHDRSLLYTLVRFLLILSNLVLAALGLINLLPWCITYTYIV